MRRQNRRERGGDLPLHSHADERVGRAERFDRPKQPQTPQPKQNVAPLRPKTLAQGRYAKHIRGRALTIGSGDAGTGKTFVSISVACEMLVDGEIEKIIATRPMVSADEDPGFLPGGISEKFAPFFQPILDVLNRRLGATYVDWAIKNGVIVALPLAYMRGLTFEKSFVLMDEAQNSTPGQMKMFLTRLGEPVKCVIEGDETQTDITGLNGLADVMHRFRGHPDVGHVKFTEDDVVRSGFVRDVLLAYRKPVPVASGASLHVEVEADIPLPEGLLASR